MLTKGFKLAYDAVNPQHIVRGLLESNMMTTFQQLEAAEYEAAYNPADRFAGFDCGDRDYDYEAALQDQNEEFARENGL